MEFYIMNMYQIYNNIWFNKNAYDAYGEGKSVRFNGKILYGSGIKNYIKMDFLLLFIL